MQCLPDRRSNIEAETGLALAVERVAPRRGPRRSRRAMQTSLRGCDGEMDLSTSGLLGGRTRSKATGAPVARRQDPLLGLARPYTLSSQMNSTETNRLLIAWPRIAGRRLRVRS